MRRTVVLLGLAALATIVLPPAPAASGAALGDAPCSLIPIPAGGDTAPLGSGACPGVRPGGRVRTVVGGCTLNFLFRAPDGTRYIGTAGHCVRAGEKWPQEKVWARGAGPVAEDGTGHRIGEFAYSVVHQPKDFALIRLDPSVDASPEMCHFGTPRGLSRTDNPLPAPVVLQYYGNGIGIRDVVPARTAVAIGTPHPDHIYAAGLAIPGDSGAGVMTSDGLAIGVLVSTGLQGVQFELGPFGTPRPRQLPEVSEKGVDTGTMGITRLAPQLARASEQLGVRLELVTAS